MIRTFYLFSILIISLLHISCKDSKQEIIEETPSPSEQEIVNTMMQNTETVEQFLFVFKKAVAEKDKLVLQDISDMEALGADFYSDSFFEIWSEQVSMLNEEDLELSLDIHDALSFQIEDIPEDEDSDEAAVGMALQFIIKKVDGRYKIIEAMGIG